MVSAVLQIIVLNQTTKENERHENALRVKTPCNGTKTKKKIYLNVQKTTHKHQRAVGKQAGHSIRYSEQ